MFQFGEFRQSPMFFWVARKWVEEGAWAGISPAAKAVLPVIACHCNPEGRAFPGERTIAVLSGRTDKGARQGIRDLAGFPGFRATAYTTARGARSKRFSLDLPRRPQPGEAFPFHRDIINGGNWREATPSAQALYMAMRACSFFDLDFYSWTHDSAFDMANFAQRDCDFCTAAYSRLARLAGISRRSVYPALKSLERVRLVEDVPPGDHGDEAAWKVFLRPAKSMDKDFLNQRTAVAYRHERDRLCRRAPWPGRDISTQKSTGVRNVA